MKTKLSIHEYDFRKENFNRQLKGNKTYTSSKTKKELVNPFFKVLDKDEFEIVNKFYDYLRIYEENKHGDLRKRMLVHRLYLLRKNGLSIKLHKINEKNIDTVVIDLSEMKQKRETFNGWKSALRKFLYWRAYGKETPRKIRELGFPMTAKKIHISKGRATERTTFAYEDCLTRNELLRIIQSTQSVRDKAFMSFIIETGARVSEIGNLKVRDLKFEDTNSPMYLVKMRGKTGERTNSIQIYFKQLNEWLMEHPNKDKPNFNESPLWVNTTHKLGKHMTYSNFAKIISRAGKKAGIQKRIYAHLFRHTWITHKDEEGWNSQEIGDWVGWTKNTDMFARYSHTDSRRVIEKKTNMLGGKAKEYKADYLNCTNSDCSCINPKFHETCWKCKEPLTEDSKIHYKTKRAREEEYELTTIKLQAQMEKISVQFNQMVKTGYVGGSKI